MGGNALSCGSVRMDAKTYHSVSQEMMTNPTFRVRNSGELSRYYDNVRVIPSYEDKDSFGDIDILCYYSSNSIRQTNKPLFNLIRKTYGATEIKRNGNVVSFDLRKLPSGVLSSPGEPAIQVDLVESYSSQEFEFSLDYFSYNDLGNLIGRIAHQMGFKFGHDGLSYNYMNGTELIKKIFLTKDFSIALNFLGYDPSIFYQGFKTLEDIFRYVTSSRYFRPEIFLLENRDGESRRRDAKRKTYMGFLKYCDSPNNQFLPAVSLTKQEGLVEALSCFPSFEVEFSKATNSVFIAKQIRVAFNGDLVGGITGFEGEELWRYMQYVKDSYRSPALFIKAALEDPQEVNNRIGDLKQGFLSKPALKEVG